MIIPNISVQIEKTKSRPINRNLVFAECYMKNPGLSGAEYSTARWSE